MDRVDRNVQLYCHVNWLEVFYSQFRPVIYPHCCGACPQQWFTMRLLHTELPLLGLGHACDYAVTISMVKSMVKSSLRFFLSLIFLTLTPVE